MPWLEENGSALLSGSEADLEDTTMEENFTLSCAARNIQSLVELPFSASLLTTIRVFQSAYFLILVLFAGSFLNGFMITLVVKYTKLHTLTFGIALQVLVLDLLSSLIFGLFGFISSVANRWIFGKYICVFTGTLLTGVSVSRASIMFVFVFDRFFSVFFPFGYPKFQNKVAIVLSATSWILSIALSVIGIGLDCYTFSTTSSLCLYSNICNDNCSAYFGVVFVAFISPVTIVPVVFYIFLFIKAKKAKKAIIEGAALSERYGSDRKATITFFIMFIAIFVLVLPTSAVSIIIHLLHQGEQPSAILQILSGVIYSFFVISDPIVILRNGDVKEVLTELKSKFKKSNIITPGDIEMKSHNSVIKS